MLLLAVVDWRLAASVALKGENEVVGGRRTPLGFGSVSAALAFTLFHCYLLHSSQVLELGIADLLLQHELLEVLGCVGLSL